MKLRLLIADPDVSCANLAARGLRNCGYEVDTALHALSCLHQLQASPPDLLILSSDLAWGGSDGILEQMRQGELPEVPVILMSASQVPGEPAPPVAALLPKPFHLDDLVRSTQRTLACSHQLAD